MASFPADCLLPEGEYTSREALFKAINEWAAVRGYAFTTGKSTKKQSGKQVVTYAYNRSQRLPNLVQQRQRNTTTRSITCPFSILAKESLDKAY